MSKLYKVYEDYETTYAICTEQGIIDLSNNIRLITEEKITDFTTARKYLEEEKFLNVVELEDNYIIIE